MPSSFNCCSAPADPESSRVNGCFFTLELISRLFWIHADLTDGNKYAHAHERKSWVQASGLNQVDRDVDVAPRRFGIGARLMRTIHKFLRDFAVHTGQAGVEAGLQEVA